MKNNITKNLIILGAIVFAFVALHNVSAVYYPQYTSDPLMPNYSNTDYYQYDMYGDSGMNNNNSGYNYNQNYNDPYYNPNTQNQSGNPVINNYYYPTIPVTTAKSTTSTTSKVATSTTTKNTTASKTTNDNTNSGASLSDNGGQLNGSDLTALSLRGSGGFMPSSIWQWILVIILILAIIVISRMIINRKVVVQEAHTAHAH